MDILQTALVFMVFIVCLFLVIFGLMFFLILKELKKGLDKLNQFLETSEQVASELGKPMAAAAGWASAAGLVVKVISGIINKKGKGYPKVKVTEKE